MDEKSEQVLKVFVENLEGMPMIGAEVRIDYLGQPVGTLSFGGESSVVFEDLGGLTLSVRHRLGAAQLTVTPGMREARLVIPTKLSIELAAIPTARCPDGRSGQPCVTCRVGRHEIRICA